MDYGFKFQIGQVVKLVAQPDTEAFTRLYRLQVVERLLHECPGGVQRSYHCRIVSGMPSDHLVSFNEIELAELPVQAQEATP